ncbi:MAG: CinA family nicotinamide mononucleotide deamidase-related protein [Bacteroidetes bacterium]|nr:CinA family nicotinamide mononucleotide deamidase-related protein [Bacteroidota bacterium]
MQTINASIITIGDELLIGQTIDTNSAYIAQELNKIGIWMRRRVAVGDVYNDIWKALDEEGSHSQIVIITGGLGPTADDITKPLLCNYFGGTLVVNEKVLAHVKHLFEVVFRRPGPILERNLKQAEVPDVCTVLFNERGTAPGMLFTKPNAAPDAPPTLFFSLPGVPHEMKGLMNKEVIPAILKAFHMPAIVHRTSVTFGQGESMIAEMLKDFEAGLPDTVKLAYLPNYGIVKLRLTGRGNTTDEANQLVEPLFQQLQELVKESLVSNHDEGLESVVGNILLKKGKTMGTAESCTGGYIAHLITSRRGSSAYYKGSVISYANEIKEHLLGVSPQTLTTAGAVSEETVQQMVKGALSELNTDYALVTSGIMGPDGGSDEKPVGTVWVAAGTRLPDGNLHIETLQLHLRFDRMRNISMTANHALNFLRKFILRY